MGWSVLGVLIGARIGVLWTLEGLRRSIVSAALGLGACAAQRVRNTCWKLSDPIRAHVSI